MSFFFLRKPRPPRSTRTDTLFPDTTLFRIAPVSLGKVPGPGLAALEQAGASRGCVMRGMRVTLCSCNHGLQVEPCCPGMVLPIRSQGAPIGDGLFGAAGIEGSDLARFKARAAACVENLLSPCGEG